MTNHADHNHPATPAARKTCRNALRADIKKLQAEYMALPDFVTHENRTQVAEYEAGIDLFAGRWNMDLHAAYDLVEHGPVITR